MKSGKLEPNHGKNGQKRAKARRKGKKQDAPKPQKQTPHAGNPGAEPKNVGGRPETRHKTLPLYPSMSACSGATGIPMAVLSSAKGKGCPAFNSGSNVDLEKLLPWLFRPGAGAEAATSDAIEEQGSQKRLLLWKAKREEIKYKEESGMMADRGEVRDGLQSAQFEVFAILDRVFCSELPPRLIGHREPGIREICKKEIEELKDVLRSRFKAICETSTKSRIEEEKRVQEEFNLSSNESTESDTKK